MDINKIMAETFAESEARIKRIKATPRIVYKDWFGGYKLANLGNCNYFQDQHKEDLVSIYGNAFHLSLSKPRVKFLDNESIKKIEAIESKIKELKSNLETEIKNSFNKSKKIVWLDDLK